MVNYKTGSIAIENLYGAIHVDAHEKLTPFDGNAIGVFVTQPGDEPELATVSTRVEVEARRINIAVGN